MKYFSNRKASKKTLKEIHERLLNGEQFSVEDIVSEYFKPKTPYAYLQAKAKAQSWMTRMSATINKIQDDLFGCLPNSKYGFAKDVVETNWITTRAYRTTKGNVINSYRKIQNAVQSGLLKAKKEDIKYLKPIIQNENSVI